MSMIDKVVAAVTPAESDKSRKEARSRAGAAATAGDWLSMVLHHHQQIEAAFHRVTTAADAATRVSAYKHLGLILTGHSIAEENVVYPALAGIDEKAHALMAYTEQAGAKLEMGLLEQLAPMSQEFLDSLEHVRAAVAHHMHEEEGTWFIQLKEKLSADEQEKLTARFKEEFNRYVGTDGTQGARKVA